MPYFDLPFRRERSAPVLDASDTSAIWRYFEDLEVLFARHRVSDDAEKKRAATRYPSIEVERLWQCACAFSDPARTYEDFKEEVIRMYPEISRDRMHTLADLEEAVGQAARKDIRSEEDLGAYYRHFLCISRYLIDRGRLAPIEQSRAFLRGFRPPLEAQVRERLQAKFLDHIPGDPYATDDVFDAARFVLARNRAAASPEAQGPNRATFTLKVQTPQQTSDTAVPNTVPTPDSADPTPDAIDKLAAAVEALREMVKATTQTRAESGEPAPEAQPATSRPRRDRCKFCGREGHTFHECVIIGDYIQQGRCRYSPLGNVVLSTGAAVPGGTPGAWMRNRVDKWHQQHPGQLAELVLRGAGATPTTVPAPQGQAVEYPDQRTRMRPSARYIPDSVQHRHPERAQAEQRSEVYQPATRHRVATEVIRSEEQRPESVRAYAHRTEVHPGASAKSARAPVAAPEPAQTVWPASPDSPDLAETQRESPSEAQQAQSVQHSEAPQSAKQGRAAAKISRSEEQRPETVCAYAHRTEVNPGVRATPVRVRVRVRVPEPEPPPITIPLKDLLAIFAGATAEVQKPKDEERELQAPGVFDRVGGLTAEAAPEIRKREEAMAMRMPVAFAPAVPVGPEASTPRSARAVAAQAKSAVAKPVPESPSPEVDSETRTETSSEQDVQAATSPEEALEIVQSSFALTPEPASIANREAPRIDLSRAKSQQIDSDSSIANRESQNPIAPAPHTVRPARESEASHFELAASLQRPPLVRPQPRVWSSQLGGAIPDPDRDPRVHTSDSSIPYKSGCESIPRASTDSRLRAANFFNWEEGPRAPEGGRKTTRARTRLPQELHHRPPAVSVPTPRDVPPQRTPTHTSPLPILLSPTPFPRFPPAPQSLLFAPHSTGSSDSAPSSQCPAPSETSSRRELLQLAVAQAAPPPIRTPTHTSDAFLQVQTTPFPAESEAPKRRCAHPEAVRIPTAAQQRTHQRLADEVAPVSPSPERIPEARRQVQDAPRAVPARRHRRADPAKALRKPTAPHVPPSPTESHASHRRPRRASIPIYRDRDKYSTGDPYAIQVPRSRAHSKSPPHHTQRLRIPRSTPASLEVEREPFEHVARDGIGVAYDRKPVQCAHEVVSAGRKARQYTHQREHIPRRATFAHASADHIQGPKHRQYPSTRLEVPRRRARYRQRRLKSHSAIWSTATIG